MYVVRLLAGALEVTRHGEPVALTPKQRRVVSLLALRSGVVPLEQLQEHLSLSIGGLRTTVSRLRAELGAGLIMSEHQGYRLTADEIDVRTFADCLQMAGSGTLDERIVALEQGLALWQGDPFQDVADAEWARPEIVRLHAERASAEEDLAELLLSTDRPRESIALLRSNIARNPFRDRPRGILLSAMAGEGRHTEALREFQDYRQLLADEVGTEPSAELIAIDRRIASGGTFGPPTNLGGVNRGRVEGSESALPTGLLTYLFTDIEGSTSLWAQDPIHMSAALEAHDQVLTQSIAAAGGHLVKHTGDGVMAVFAEPSAAAEAAVAAQRRLELPVRMGIHCGIAFQRGQDYFGKCVSRTARLMSLAHAGQVLVSEDAVPFLDSTVVLDLGQQLLPGMLAPETAFQLLDPSLRDRFPPLRSSVTTPNNIPQPVSALVGRSAEVEELLELLQAHRMVSILGIGGAGKTRLAIEVARRSLENFKDGVFFIELSSVANPDHIVSTIARAIGIRESTGAGPTPLGNLARFLADRRVLIVLDNCEHLGSAPALAAESLLMQATRSHIVATSRQNLGVAGERVFRTPPLAIETAVKLFVDRARAVRPSFALTDESLALCEEICNRLDKIPLAIELAAAQTVAMDAPQILSRLHNAVDMVGIVESSAGRHRTLRAAVGWSYDTLTPYEQEVFRMLSVFAGAFPLEGVEFVCDAESDGGFAGVIGALVSLVTKSLVETDTDTGRYRLLQIVQQFAVGELAATQDETKVRDRHATFYADRAAQLRRDVYKAGTRADPSDLANLRVVAEYCLACGDRTQLLQLIVGGHEYWSHAGAATDIETWLVEALREDTTDIEIDLRIQALATVASALTIARPQGTSAIDLGEQAVELSQSRGASKQSQFLASSDLGYAYVQSDARDPRGRELLMRSLDYADGNALFEMRSYSRLSVAAFIGGHQALGLEPAERAFDIATDAGLPVFAKVAQSFRAATRAVVGDTAGARNDLQQLETLPEDLDPIWLGTIHVTAANGWLALGEQGRALRHLAPALALPIEDTGDVICTMITSTTCMIEKLPPTLVATAIGAVENFHSASQPMLREQLDSARDRTIHQLGRADFDEAFAAGQDALLDHVHANLRDWIVAAERERVEA